MIHTPKPFRIAFAVLLISAGFLLTLSAQVVLPEEAKSVAGTIFMFSGGKADPKGIVSAEPATFADTHGNPLIYIFTESKGGFVIISGEKSAYPILAFSGTDEPPGLPAFSPDTASWPPSLTEWLDNRLIEIAFIRNNMLPPSSATTEMWGRLEKGYDPGINGAKSVTPLMTTTWNQTCGYNALCPVDSRGPCNRVVTGCVATAMAQVIRHNEHPVNGTGSRCYTTSAYGELCADFSTANYDYANMPDNSGNAEVAKLIYHCGVAVSMNYGPYGSSAYSSSVANAMRTWYDYTNGLIISKGSYSEDNWTRILKNELYANRPVYYSGHGTGGHAFVIDGYKETSHFHLNWGWGGAYNGYFYLSALNPGSMNFTSSQQGIIGMIPTATFTGPDFSSAITLPCKTPLNGDISSGTDNVNYYKNTWPATPGKELIYTFTTTLPGRIRIKITNQTASVYTFLLNHQHKDSLTAYGTNGLTVDNTLPGTWYIVVEGYAAEEPTFTIEVVCPTSDADLDIQSASVAPQYIESLQPNVNLNSRVRNIGNTPAPPCTMEYFLSTDNIFDEGVDLFLGNQGIPAIGTGQSANVASVITMPNGLAPGYYHIIFVADRANIVPETDDENYYSVYVTVPETGILNCASAIALTDGQWYYGNTLAQGVNLVENYSMGYGLTGPEVVHSFTPLYNGLVNISFVEKSPGMLYALVLPVCNENTSETSLRIFNLTDTLTTTEFYAIAGNQYFIVVDGEKGAFGDYGLRVDLPAQCPVVKLDKWGKTDMCDGDRWPSFWTFWGFSSYQWYRNGIPVPGATNSSFTPSATGNYHLVVTENGCPGSSEIVELRMDPVPDTASIVSLGDTTFCSGGNVVLGLESAVSWPLNWAVDGVLIPGATENTCTVADQGIYSVFTINGACSVESRNKLTVRTLPLPAGEGEMLPIPSREVAFNYPFTTDNNDVSGNGSMLIGWDYEPANDRSGGFWQARHLRGNTEIMYSSAFDSIPLKFTLGIWIKTTTSKGGVVAGFYDNPWGPTLMDAILYMSDDGRLRFWFSNGGTPTELTTTGQYNDGVWHCVVIGHDGNAFIGVDDGTEMVVSDLPTLKQPFKGYWTIGGPAIPAAVAAMPASLCWEGTFDDLILLREGNNLLLSYMYSNPLFNVDPLPEQICESGTVSFMIPVTQTGTEYRVWNHTGGYWYTSAGAGNGSSLLLDGITEINSMNEFHVMALDTVTGCDRVVAIIHKGTDICTPADNVVAAQSPKVWPVPSDNVVYFESANQILELRIFDYSGRVVHSTRPGRAAGAVIEVNVMGWSAGVYHYRATTSEGLPVSGRLIVR